MNSYKGITSESMVKAANELHFITPVIKKMISAGILDTLDIDGKTVINPLTLKIVKRELKVFFKLRNKYSMLR